jgi:hypothetical protein
VYDEPDQRPARVFNRTPDSSGRLCSAKTPDETEVFIAPEFQKKAERLFTIGEVEDASEE